MSGIDCSLYLLVAIFFALVQGGTSLKCYACKSSRDEPCGNPTTSNSVAIQECSNSDDICFHIDYNVNATEGYSQYVERRCVSPNFIVCPAPPLGGYVYCTVCDTNLCNNEPTTLEPSNEIIDENIIGENVGNNDKGDDGSTAALLPTFILSSITLIVLLNNM